MSSLHWIVVSGLAMTAVAATGGVLLLVTARVERWLPPVVAFSAGALIGGALFHLLPHALGRAPDGRTFEWLLVGFASFLALDQLLEWHHCRRPGASHVRPLAPLLLLADGLHNFLGGLAIGAVFLVDVRAGWMAWMAAALHEVPQELGDFGALVHAGMSRRRALVLNVLSGATFLLGGLLSWLLGAAIDVTFLLAVGAGNFVYIAAADLIPEVKRSERIGDTILRFAAFAAGAALLWALRGLELGA